MCEGERLGAAVIGAGQAGVSLSYYLTQRGVRHVVLERDRPFSSWRGRWEGFRANTPGWLTTLPMRPAPVPGDDVDGFATRDQLVEYLDACYDTVSPPLRTATVTRVTQQPDGWAVSTDDGEYLADNVAVCTGAMSVPRLPVAATRLPADVVQLHSSEYRNPEQITTSRVLVVGSGSSGVQIVRLLAESGRFAELHLALSKVLVLPTRVAGIPVHKAVGRLGLLDVRVNSALGRLMYSGFETRGDPILPPTPRRLARKHGMVLHGRLTEVTGEGPGRRIRFDDGSALATSDLTVIWCTGFTGDYSFIEPADRAAAFDERGYPRHERGIVAGAPGLSFVGLRYQHTSGSHDIYGVGRDAEYVAQHIAARTSGAAAPPAVRPRRGLSAVSAPVVLPGHEAPLKLVDVPACCACDSTERELIGRGWDYEYRTGPDVFDAQKCRVCGNVYLDPRPDVSEFQRIYTQEYHSLEFTEENFSLIHQVRSKLEANRLLRYCEGAPADARILDVGCGDGFHLKLLRRYGPAGWTLEGVDLDPRAVQVAARSGITVHEGTIEELDLGENRYDVVYTIMTVEHVAHPDRMLAAIHRLLKPGGRLVIVTDNTDSYDATWFRTSYWGGYHFPRHWNLFNPDALTRLGLKTGFLVDRIDTMVSPVNWTYSVHNALVGHRAPQWLVNLFSLRSPLALGAFTVLDMALQRTGRGALLNAYLVKPR